MDKQAFSDFFPIVRGTRPPGPKQLELITRMAALGSNAGISKSGSRWIVWYDGTEADCQNLDEATEVVEEFEQNK